MYFKFGPTGAIDFRDQITWMYDLGSDIVICYCYSHTDFFHSGLTHWGRDKMAAIFQTTFSNAFPRMKIYEFRLKFHWSLFLRIQIIIVQHRFRSWLGTNQATSHYLNQWWLDYRRIYVPLGLNELNKIQYMITDSCHIDLRINMEKLQSFVFQCPSPITPVVLRRLPWGSTKLKIELIPCFSSYRCFMFVLRLE